MTRMLRWNASLPAAGAAAQARRGGIHSPAGVLAWSAGAGGCGTGGDCKSPALGARGADGAGNLSDFDGGVVLRTDKDEAARSWGMRAQALGPCGANMDEQIRLVGQQLTVSIMASRIMGGRGGIRAAEHQGIPAPASFSVADTLR